MSYRTAVRREIRGLWAGGTGKTLLAIALGWGLLNGTRMIYPVLLPYFSEDFGLTLTTAGLLVTIIWLCYAIGQVPGGILADRYGERRILTISVSVVIVGLGLVLLAPTATVLFLATGFVGFGLSQYPIARMTALSDLYPDRIGSALGVTMAAGDIGQTVLPPIASVLAVWVAWQAGLGYVLPILGLAAVIIWLTLPTSDSPTDSSEDDADTDWGAIRETFRNPTILFTGVVMFVFLFVWQTFSAFYPTYLTVEKGVSPTVAGGLFGLFFAVGVVIKPLAGTAYDRIGIRASLPLVLGGAAIGFALLPSVEGFWPIVGVTVLMSTMLGSGAITQSYLTETIPPEVQGTGLGLIRSSASMLGATGPVVFGWIAERGYFDEGYFLMAAIVGLITLLTLRMPQE
ncbi:MFS transporter [Natronorubrum daqingense]|uniref:MFS transporter n=1 Tax=Natronorubrum daqingense TaxID=588898 RepID=A0A1N7A7U1_9EURY|nr:MFS transporter [Natronorubrum daqingense]APX98080.1 MFS transporter [Natronorubrum daqingense]SIR35162.1 Predicted arabinose efflux permease, MFS family [Natronorubrum daqingense]